MKTTELLFLSFFTASAAAPQVLTKGLQRMKQYLTTETDLAPYKDMILWKNADLLFNIKQ